MVQNFGTLFFYAKIATELYINVHALMAFIGIDSSTGKT
jgi:hypothetical protein